MTTSDNTSTDRMAAIAARAEAASEGPWAHTADRYGDRVEGADGHWLTYGDDECGPTAELADAEFIAHARTDVPDLVTALQRVRALHASGPAHPTRPDVFPPECTGCPPTGYLDIPTDWPCPTYLATLLPGETAG